MVPDDMAAAAERHGLGELQEMVENRPKRRPWLSIVTLGACGAGAAAWGVSIALRNEQQNGGWYFGLPMFLGSLFVLWVAAWLRFRPGPTKAWVARYERGLVHRIADAAPRAYPWEAVRSVARNDVRVVKPAATYVLDNLLIVPENGQVISVDNYYDGTRGFAERLTRAFAQARAPREIVRLKAGARLRYGGQLAVDEAGVSTRDGQLGWRDLDRIDFGPSGVMRVYRHGQRKAHLSVSAAGLPNLLVFLTVAEEMRRRAAV